MRNVNLFKIVLFTILAIVTLAGSGDSASARSGEYWNTNGGYGVYGFYRVPLFRFNSYYRIAPIRRLAVGVRNRWAARSYFNYYYYNGNFGRFGVCRNLNCYRETCCCPLECCSSVNCVNQPVINSSPLIPSPDQSKPQSPPSDEKTPAIRSVIEQNIARLHLVVPPESRVFVNGLPTRTSGDKRTYISRDLKTGQERAYDLRVEYQVAGQPVIQSRIVDLKGGSMVTARFGQESVVDDADPTDSSPTTTVVSVRVPKDARVVLAGSSTTTTGSVRHYKTTKLDAGEVWENYTVRVELDRNGSTLSSERTVKITGGETHELNFDFANSDFQVVQRFR